MIGTAFLTVALMASLLSTRDVVAARSHAPHSGQAAVNRVTPAAAAPYIRKEKPKQD
jgi:hypothetical protein